MAHENEMAAGSQNNALGAKAVSAWLHFDAGLICIVSSMFGFAVGTEHWFSALIFSLAVVLGFFSLRQTIGWLRFGRP